MIFISALPIDSQIINLLPSAILFLSFCTWVPFVGMPVLIYFLYDKWPGFFSSWKTISPAPESLDEYDREDLLAVFISYSHSLFERFVETTTVLAYILMSFLIAAAIRQTF